MIIVPCTKALNVITGKIEPVFCMNPYRQKRHGDAMVMPSEIKEALYVRNLPLELSWFEVRTFDGRHIQTELRKNQPDIIELMENMIKAGVRIQFHTGEIEHKPRG